MNGTQTSESGTSTTLLKSLKIGEITSYVWDYRNRLTNVETKTSGGVLTRSVAFKYDIFDRRIAKTLDLDGAGAGVAVTERYVYDRDHIMLVFVGATLKERYLYGANLDQVLAVEGSQVSWTLSDYLGTVRDLVSSAGVVQNHIKYDSFGNVTAQSNSAIKSRFGFTGRELDAETGLYYYRSRYYDAAVGRFLSEDLISFAGGDANLFGYMGSSPTNGTDPWGLSAQNPNIIDDLIVPIIWGIIGAIGALGGAAINGLGGLLNRGSGGTTAPAPAPTTAPTTDPTPSPSPTPPMAPVPNTGAASELANALKNASCKEEDKKRRTCNDPPFNAYDRCSSLEGNGYERTRNDAISLIRSYRKRFLTFDELTPGSPDPFLDHYKFGCKSPDQAAHFNIFISGTKTSAGSVGRCKCCIERGGQPSIENFRFKPLNAKDRAQNKYNL
jgi:RHS repeat-associated protein